MNNLAESRNNLNSHDDTDLQFPLIYHRHPINLLWPGVVSGIALVVTIFTAVLLPVLGIVPIPDYLPYIILFTGLIIFVIITCFFMNWAFWFFDVWIITEDKIIDDELVRLFSYRRLEIDLRQVQDVRCEVTGIMPNLFKFGDIIVQSAGKEGELRLLSIYEPYKAARKIALAVKRAKDADVDSAFIAAQETSGSDN